jgi:N-acetylmuramoyl-L-alanine amidase
LTFNLKRALASELWMDGKTVRLTIKKPLGSGNLAGMTIVVDPGHGGHDSGTKANGVTEKELNLIMGKLIADKLTAEGANVIITRRTDVFITLPNRAKIANDNDADLFISTHINSTAKGGSQSGSIVFHHKGNEVGKMLAQCIFDEIADVNGLPDLGVWSDGRIYQSGFSVLRNTKMPGVLLELGFMNNPTDRNRMVTKDFQDKVAAAVVKGIKVYLANGS